MSGGAGEQPDLSPKVDIEFSMDPERLFVPAGHYYSPIAGSADTDRYRARLRQGGSDELQGIELNEREQMEHLGAMMREYRELPGLAAHRSSTCRYYYLNPEFGYQDAVALRYFMRLFRPRRIVEIGCGHSSTAMLDFADQYLSPQPAFTFIDPNAERLIANVSEYDLGRLQLLQCPVQDVPLTVFDSLERDDIIFIDTSHVVKLCGDVNFYLFEILPVLASGVVIHIHDIGYAFEYPEKFVLQNRCWNEAYAVRAFLMYNSAFSIIAWNAYYNVRHSEHLADMTLCRQQPGGSLWIQKR